MMSEDELFALYADAWRRAETAGAFVTFHGMDEPAGYFHANERPGGFASPAIFIARPFAEKDGPMPTRGRGPEAPATMPAPNIEDELITLAHEFGHFTSWAEARHQPERRSRWTEYSAIAHKRDAARDQIWEAMPPDLPPELKGAAARSGLFIALNDDDRARIVEEEEFAWRIGRELLADLGFRDWEAFDARERAGLHYHRYNLGIEDAWPSDAD